MKTEQASYRLRAFARVKLLLTCLALSLIAGQSASAITYKLVHAFAGGAKDGDDPLWGSTLLPSGSTFYAVTSQGGSASNGVLFQINMNGTGEHVIHTFTGIAILTPNGSKNDGAFPIGTPVLIGSTLYGMTQQGGSNATGTIFQVNTDGSGFQILHHFGNLGDGSTPYGSLLASGTNLFGMTEGGGTNGASQGIVFSIGISGSGYQIMHNFLPADGTSPEGSLMEAGGVLFGMTQSSIFKINPDGSGYQVLHTFIGTTADGFTAYGSLVGAGPVLYGMTSQGGLNNLGTIFQFDTNMTNFQILHNFAISEAWGPYGDLALSGSTLYGMSRTGVTNYHNISVGSGAVFQFDTSGSGYKLLHTFLFPIVGTDGSTPFASPVVVGSDVFGMTSLGGSKQDKGCIFELSLAGGSGGTTTPGAPTLTLTSPSKNATVTVASATVAGTTHGSPAITNVVVTLNGSNTLTAISSDNFVHWAAAATNLPPGTNTITAYAVNANGMVSASKTSSFFYKVTAKLGGSIAGHGVLSPNDIGKTLNINEGYTMKAIAAAGFKFSNWSLTISTNTTTDTNSKLTFQMVSNLQITATFADVLKPTVTITTKTGTGSNSVVVIAGKAKDNVGVAAVWFQVGSNGWNIAETSDAFTNWTANALLGQGANTIQVYAEDAAGNRSTTNSVTLSDTATGFAPGAIADTALDLVMSNSTAELAFGGSTFSQTDGTNSAVGLYTYSLTDANTAELTLYITAPPTLVPTNSATNVVTLSFTTGNNGTFTNFGTNAGTFSIADGSSTAPASLSGLTLQGADTGTNVFQFTNVYGDGVFIGTNTSGNSSGAYTFAQFSPSAAIVTAGLTNGTTNFLLLNFGAASNVYSFVSVNNTNEGTFTVTSEPATAGFTAPESLSGLSGAATEVNTSGKRKSFDLGLNDGTYGTFSTVTNQDSQLGTYTFARTGAKTGTLQIAAVLPPEESSNNETISMTFVNSHTANFTDSDGHGTISFSTPSSTAPLSLIGRTLIGSGKGGSGGFTFGNNSFTGSGGDNGKTGAYTYSVFGPQLALATMYFTDANDTGKTRYLFLWFSTAKGGSFREDDGTGNVSAGTFSVK